MTPERPAGAPKASRSRARFSPDTATTARAAALARTTSDNRPPSSAGWLGAT
ncbi:hypothetical protein [Desulfovibrio sp. DV]|uniref:hypothetical protein n=1 Tax=Desulfovibrio sp. DV TaxID=1844708 RepID=UPI001587FA0A|nr:hypothetical protein [Desulfovibrio sp. DV]